MVRSIPVWLSAALLAVACGCGQPKKLVPLADAGFALLPMETCFDSDGDGVPGTGDCQDLPLRDCNDSDPTTKPTAVEICDFIDNDCNGKIDEGLTTSAFYRDADADSIGSSEKTGEGCGAPPVGSVTSTGDCNDADSKIRPGVAETCNAIDDDCDGVKDNGVPFQDFYVDADGDSFGDSASTAISSCRAMEQGRVPNKADCNDSNPTVKPGISELCNKVDDNCDGQVDNGISFQNYYPDVDGDSFGSDGAASESACAPVAGKVTNSSDCNDSAPTVKPGAPETCNAVDDNCNGQIDEGLSFASYYVDGDGDGFGKAGTTAQNACLPVAGKVTNNTDCNDMNPTVKPGASELCNGVDDNCNGTADDGLTFQSYFVDNDGDGFGSGAGLSSCAAIAGRVTNNTDCNDGNATIKPGAAEVCNSVDDNCNVQVDEGLTFQNYWPDNDGDTFGNQSAMPINACHPIAGRVTNNGDCNDGLFTVKPGAPEVCNGIDDNCNLSTDEGQTFVNYYTDADGDLYGSTTAIAHSACAAVAGKVTNNTDCNDAASSIHPGAIEACNSIDDNCDTLVDNGTMTQNYYPDLDGDGYGAMAATPINSCSPIAGRVTSNTDCNDSNAAVKPGAMEVCNAVDDNCVGGIDEGLPTNNYYTDADGDGFGAVASAAQASCGPVSGKAANNTDCNDTNAAVRPNANEVCNGLDDNCNGAVDEPFPTKGQTCTAGLGVCLRSGTMICTVNQLAVTCSAVAGPATAMACDGLDNDCDGVVDEPALASTNDVSTTAWSDIEVEPYYYSAAGCAGGGNASGGTDAWVGGGMAMGGSTGGLYFQPLSITGAPVGSPGTGSVGLAYTDIDLAQAGDGFIIAGLYKYTGPDYDIDLNYMDAATGVKRAQLWSQFAAPGTIDSLRLVRGDGRRVTLIWREAGVGIKLARVEACFVEGAWAIRQPGCAAGALPAPLLFPNTATYPSGLGADSTHQDWVTSQTCPPAGSYRKLGVAWRTAPGIITQFTVDEDGLLKSAETTVRTYAGTQTVDAPEIVFFRSAAADQYFVSYVMRDTGTAPRADLEYWLTTAPSYNFAYLSDGTLNGAASIQRPRASVTATQVWMSAVRYDVDPTGTTFTRQVMTRQTDFAGVKSPNGSLVEVSATTGTCTGQPASCRPGNKEGLTNWAPFKRLYYSGSGSTPAGTFTSALSCY